jgi:hypothetical protein
MKVNFSKIVIKDIEGRDVPADFQLRPGRGGTFRKGMRNSKERRARVFIHRAVCH